MIRDDKSYLLGYILGDGMLKCYKSKGCEVKVTEKDHNHIRYIAELITRVYNVEPSIIREKNYWKARIFKKRIHDLILEEINVLIRNSNSSFIGGLFDAEGDCTASKKRLRFTNKDHRIIVTIAEYLAAQGIKSNIYKRTRGNYVWYTLEIYNSHALKAFRTLDLRHPKWMLCLLK